MLELVAAAPTLEPWELGLRVLVAAALGGVVGLERELSDQPAGFRTHMLVSLGSALFTMVGAYGLSAFIPENAENTSFDPMRVAAQVVTGIGFLGAGAIIRQGVSIRGLTTAASLWVTAAIGMAAGVGFWLGAVFTTLGTVIALYGFKQIERRFFRRRRRAAPETKPEIPPD
jgi:putative Mg2+ transporter-C (MgtC) family protein